MHFKRLFYFLIFIVFYNPISYASKDNSDSSSIKNNIQNHNSHIENSILTNSGNKLSNNYVIIGTELIYKSRIEELNKQTPINLEYNKYVKTYIDLYITKKSLLISQMLGLSKLYFPIFEEAIEKHNLPYELKYRYNRLGRITN